MSQPRDWKLVFTCPACSRASEVAAGNLAAVVRCPHCRTNVVVQKDGMREARKAQKKKRRAQRDRPERARHRASKVRHNGQYQGIAWASLILVFVTGTPAIVALNIRRAPDDMHALRSAAKSFHTAWLEEDLDAAGAFVLSADRARLKQWSAPRRAALVAGFGREFRGKITAVEITQEVSQHAVVRIAYEIRGREQQAFQHWVLVDGSWRLSLTQASP